MGNASRASLITALVVFGAGTCVSAEEPKMKTSPQVTLRASPAPTYDLVCFIPVPGSHDIVVHNKGTNTVPKGKKILWSFGNRGTYLLTADFEADKNVSIPNALPNGPVPGTSCKATVRN